jgi:CPA1 family monovalent cation:H+ antiporter
MHLFDLIALLISVAALFSWFNHRWLGLPSTLGVMLMGLALSLALAALGRAGFAGLGQVDEILAAVDFDEALLHGMLSFLLFAGALGVDLDDLRQHKWVVATLASVGILISTVLVGIGSWLLFQAFGIGLPLVWCLLFGALISPTDPIAVLAILRQFEAPKALETKIAGESLFNDGVGVVVFLVLLGIATGDTPPSFLGIAELFLLEAVGGAVFGLALGGIGYRLLASVDRLDVEVLLTLAIVTGGYSLAFALHVSAPIAIVVAGLLIGNHGRRFAMSEATRHRLDEFWELVDEMMNAVLFLLIGLEVLLLTFDATHLAAGVALIPLVLAARFVSVGTPITVFRLRQEFPPRTVRLLTWGGLRGGISVALALSLPVGPVRDQLLMATYAIVLFSLVVQGLTFRRLLPAPAAPG